MESKNLSYDLTDILRFFSLSKTSLNQLHLNVILNDRNVQKPFELSLQTLQLLSLDIKSLTFSLEIKSDNDFIEEVLIEEFPLFFLDHLQELEYLQIQVLHDDFGLVPSIFEVFKSLRKLKRLKICFVKSVYFHLPYQQFILIPLIDDFLTNLNYLRVFETNVYFLGSVKEIYPQVTHLIIDISHSMLQSYELILKIKNFPNLISLELYLEDGQSIIDFFSFRRLQEFKEIIQNLTFLTELKIFQAISQIILDNKRNEGLRELIRELNEKKYLIHMETEALDQIQLIEYDENKDFNLVKKYYIFLKKKVFLQRVRFLSIIHAFDQTKLRKTYKRPQILNEILRMLM